MIADDDSHLNSSITVAVVNALNSRTDFLKMTSNLLPTNHMPAPMKEWYCTSAPLGHNRFTINQCIVQCVCEYLLQAARVQGAQQGEITQRNVCKCYWVACAQARV